MLDMKLSPPFLRVAIVLGSLVNDVINQEVRLEKMGAGEETKDRRKRGGGGLGGGQGYVRNKGREQAQQRHHTSHTWRYRDIHREGLGEGCLEGS